MKININKSLHSSPPCENRLLNIFEFLNSSITKNLTKAGIETRPFASNGLWCCLLLPTILVTYTLQYKVSPLYELVAYVSLGLVFHSCLFIVFLSSSNLVLKETVPTGCVASSLLIGLLLYTFSGLSLIFSLTISFPALLFYNLLLRFSLSKCSKTFSIGEAMIVTQSIVLYTTMTVLKYLTDIDDAKDDEMDFIFAIITTVLITVGLIVMALYHLTPEQRNINMFAYIMAGAATFAIIVLHSVLGINCIFRILCYVFMDQTKVQLFIFWVFLVVTAVIVILVRTRIAEKANTVTRKSFHILASIVFLSGIINDAYLMTLAAGVGLGLLVLVEALRKSGIEPISSALQSAFLVYSDEKDCGSFAMTPIYLYVGISGALALSSHIPEQLSGVLSTGVGDTAASWFGSKYGTRKWPGGNKTIVGTIFNILSQVMTVYILQIFELLNERNLLIRASIAATASGFVEAKTDQVDNLILPLVTIIAYQATWFLS